MKIEKTIKPFKVNDIRSIDYSPERLKDYFKSLKEAEYERCNLESLDWAIVGGVKEIFLRRNHTPMCELYIHKVNTNVFYLKAHTEGIRDIYFKVISVIHNGCRYQVIESHAIIN